jgi:SnoaL-like domain
VNSRSATAPADALQEMLDEHQLRKLVHGYCRAVDRGEMAHLRGMYHDDATDDHGAFSAGTADDFLGELAAARPHIRSMQHHVTTANFAISGNTAEGEIYGIAHHTFRARDRDVDVTVGGRYLDKYEKRDGTWKFIARKIVTDWARVNDPSSVDLSHPITRDTPRGTPDANDPSYQFFSLLTNGAE